MNSLRFGTVECLAWAHMGEGRNLTRALPGVTLSGILQAPVPFLAKEIPEGPLKLYFRVILPPKFLIKIKRT